MKRRTILLLLAALFGISSIVGMCFAANGEEPSVYLSDLTPTKAQAGWGDVHYDEDINGGTLKLNFNGTAKTYEKGVFAHVDSEVIYDISGMGVTKLTAYIGINDGTQGYKEQASADFEVLADGKQIYKSAILKLEDALYISVDIPKNTSTLTLKTTRADGTDYADHTAWCDAKLYLDPSSEGLLNSLEAYVPNPMLYTGQTAQIELTPKALGGKTMSVDSLTWTFVSSDNSVASVSSAGLITAQNEGTAIITCTASKNNRTASAKVTVNCVAVSSDSAFILTSPGGQLQILLSNSSGMLTYTVVKNGVTVIEPSVIGFECAEANMLSEFTFVSKTEVSEVNDTYKNYSGDYAYGNDRYNGQSVKFACGKYYFTVILRAYDDGYAFRTEIALQNGAVGSVSLTDEKTTVKLPAGTTLWASQIDAKNILIGNSYETGFPTVSIENTMGLYLMKAPLARVNSDLYVLLNEAELYGDPYFGSIFKGIGGNTLEYTAAPQKYTTSEAVDAMTAAQREEALKKINGIDVALDPSFVSPWRYGVVGSLAEIVESDLTDNLNQRTAEDFSWVEPGVTAWMWLSEHFDGQRNESTIREYIDLAAEMNWKYLILDEGWQPGAPAGSGKAYEGYFDYFDSLVDYANSKGVGFIVWVKLVDLNTPERREILAEWADKGIKGIKVDFVESESADVLGIVKAVYEKCAEEHLLVNEHGGNIPTGERSTWPHVINRESVKGQEYGGVWCSDSTIWPYTRAAVGPTDITPKMEATGSNTVSHQLALNVVIEAGMPCMASDTTVYYASNAKFLLKNLPACWDSLKFIDGQPSKYTILARQKGNDWYVGGITQTGTEVSFTLDFLEENTSYTAILYKDGATRNDIAVEKLTVKKGSEVSVSMADGGGFTMMVLPASEYQGATSLEAKEEILVLEAGNSAKVQLNVLPANANVDDMTYSTDNKSVAEVSYDGTVTAVGAGVAHITVSVPSAGLSCTVEVRVYQKRTYTLDSAWTVVNGNDEDPIRAGASEYTVYLPILSGDITGIPANMLLRKAPDGNFTLTVKVSGGLSVNYDSVGLMVYGGKGNMVVLTRRFHSGLGGNIFCLSTHDGTSYTEKTGSDTRTEDDAWLKLEKNGNVFTGFYSYDGTNYTKISETITSESVSSAQDLQIGICGIHGNVSVDQAKTATLSDFTLNGNRIPFAKASDVSILQVKKGESLQVVAAELLGTGNFDTLTYTVQNDNIAQVDENGVLTGVKPGVTKLFCVNKKTGQKATIEIHVYVMMSDNYGVWSVVNPQSDKMPVNSATSPYTLKMKTLTGDINGQPKNLVLTDAPAGDFTITVKVSGGLSANFQSVGLVVYNDSGSMVTMERRYNTYLSGTNIFCESTSINNAYTENYTLDTNTNANAWLKLEKTGSVFTGYFSFDGQTWIQIEKTITNEEVANSKQLKIGLIARTGTSEAETEATYTDFTLDGERIPFVPTEVLCQLLVPDDLTLTVGEGLPELPEILEGYYESGCMAPVQVTWDTSSFKADVPGTYILTATNVESGLTATWTVTVIKGTVTPPVQGVSSAAWAVMLMALCALISAGIVFKKKRSI